VDIVEYPDNVPATGGMFLAPPPTATGCGAWALMKDGCPYGTPAHGSSRHQVRGSQRSNTDEYNSLSAIGDNSLSSSSQFRLPPGGPVLNGGSISSASDSSSLEVHGEVSPRGHPGTTPGTNHGSGADAFKEESYKDSEEGMWVELSLAHGSHRRPREEDRSASQSHLTKAHQGVGNWGAAKSHSPPLGQDLLTA
jgi:hypothetical protein